MLFYNEEDITMRLLLLMSILFQTFLYAELSTIDAEIQKIRSASVQERVKLMNEFKLKVSQMNREERLAILKKMQSRIKFQVRQSHNREEFNQYQNRNQHREINQKYNQNLHTNKR